MTAAPHDAQTHETNATRWSRPAVGCASPSLPALARSASLALHGLASDLADMPPAVPEGRAAVVRALRTWDAACLAAVGGDPAMVLPAWPRWRNGLRLDPAALAVAVGCEDWRAIEDAAGECRRWAAECEAWESGEQRGAA